MIISTIIAAIAFVTLLITSFVVINQTNVLKNTNDDRLRNVVDQVNTSQQYSYEFDKRQQEQLKGLENNLDDIRTSYLTKESALARISTKRIDSEAISGKDYQVNNSILFNPTNTAGSTGPNYYIKRGATDSTKNNIQINTPGEPGAGINFTSTGNVSRMFVDTNTGIVNIPKTKLTDVRIGDNIQITDTGQWKGPINISDTLTANNITTTGSTILHQPVKINHNLKGDWYDTAPLSTWTDVNKVGASFGGPNTWSHFPWSDGNTYIRPGKTNGDINIGHDGAGNVTIGNTATNVNIDGNINLNKLCIQGTCIYKENLDKLKLLI